MVGFSFLRKEILRLRYVFADDARVERELHKVINNSDSYIPTALLPLCFSDGDHHLAISCALREAAKKDFIRITELLCECFCQPEETKTNSSSLQFNSSFFRGEFGKTRGKKIARTDYFSYC